MPKSNTKKGEKRMQGDREKLIEWIKTIVHPYFAEELADYLISKGVTIPARCGECKYRTRKGECRRLGHPMLTPQDDFYCKCGERKEG